LSLQPPDLASPPDAHETSRGLDRSVGIETGPRLSGADAVSGDDLLLRLLGLLNESVDMDRALRQAVDMLTTALGGRIGEIWLLGGEAQHVELQYSSSYESPEVAGFDAAGRALGLGSGPSMIARVVKTGRGSTVSLVVADGRGERATEAAAADIHGVLTFPIPSREGLVGVLAIFRRFIDRPTGGVHDAIPIACLHIGRFIERARAERAFHAAAVELSALASTDSITGLKNRQEFDRALRTIPRHPFAVLSIDVAGLKGVIDAHGPAAGDALLRLVGHTLGVLVRGGDVMARVGGDEFAALLPEINVYEVGVLNGHIAPGDVVAIVGAGPIGLSAMMTARLFSPSHIVAIDLADTRLEAAKRFGADVVVNNGRDDPLKVVRDLTDGLGADVAIEAVGLPATFELATSLVRPGGRIANVGVHGQPATLHLETLWTRDVTITTGLVDTFSTPTLIRLLAGGQLQTSVFVTQRYALEDMMAAYDTFGRPAETGALKVVLTAGGSSPNGKVAALAGAAA
jgi:GGDEF domain-containing protein